MYLDKDGNVIKDASTVGYKAIGVPGSVAGLALALQRHGKLKWADVIEPARRCAAHLICSRQSTPCTPVSTVSLTRGVQSHSW